MRHVSWQTDRARLQVLQAMIVDIKAHSNYWEEAGAALVAGHIAGAGGAALRGEGIERVRGILECPGAGIGS